MPRRRYLDKAAPADATYNSIRPVYRNIQVKKKDTPQRRENEAAKARARAEQARVTPANPRQASIGPYREKTAIDKAGGRLYAAAEQRRKDAEDREAAGVALNSLFKPILPSTYIDMAAAIKNGQVNNVTDALAAPYLTNSWSMRNPGKALVADILMPIAARDIAKGYKAMRMELKNPKVGIMANDPMWDRLMAEANAEGDLNKALGVRMAHYRQAAKEQLGNESVSFPFIHTVQDKYNPNFYAFDTNIEGVPTFVYGTDMTRSGKGMSLSYASKRAVSEEPNRVKRLLGTIGNPTRIDAKGSYWSDLPFNVPSYIPKNRADRLIADLNKSIDNLNKDINYAGLDIILPNLKYGDDIIRKSGNISKLLLDIPMKHHKKIYEGWYNRVEQLRKEGAKIKRMTHPDNIDFDVPFNVNDPWHRYGNSRYILNKFGDLLPDRPIPVRMEFDKTHNLYNIIRSKNSTISTRDLERHLYNLGDNQGFIIDNVYDYGGKSMPPDYKPARVYGIQNSQTIKSQAPNAYDDAGNMIPLSKRDNFNIDDLRYVLYPFAGSIGLNLYNR